MRPRRITRAFLRSWPLPALSGDSDKNARGKLLVVAGSPEMPGIAVLTATAALRSGAGKVRIAADRRVAVATGLSMPEARILPRTAASIGRQAREMGAVVIGPGLERTPALAGLVRAALAVTAREGTPLLLDAEAMTSLARGRRGVGPLPARARGRVLITPHFGEMASLLGREKRAIEKEPLATALEFSRRTGIVTVLKAADTYLCAPDGRALIHQHGPVGLATAGSGDTLAGIIGGLLARGAEPLQAAAWGVFLHAEAGRRLSRRVGRVGFLAREIVDEIPGLL